MLSGCNGSSSNNFSDNQGGNPQEQNQEQEQQEQEKEKGKDQEKTLGSSSGGCNFGLSVCGLGIACLVFMLKRKAQ